MFFVFANRRTRWSKAAAELYVRIMLQCDMAEVARHAMLRSRGLDYTLFLVFHIRSSMFYPEPRLSKQLYLPPGEKFRRLGNAYVTDGIAKIVGSH